jgi:signal transduction histidine kinase
MPSRKKVKLAFASAGAFLLIAAAAAGISISRLTTNLKWIAHTYDVQVALGDISSSMTVAGRTRSGFDSTGDENLLQKFDNVANSIPQKLAHLEELISDNPQQRSAIARLRDLELRRLTILREAIETRTLGPRDDASQHETSSQMVSLGTDADVVTQEMLDNEERLLVSRRAASNFLYAIVMWILVLAFAVSLVLFYVYYRLLETELSERERAEKLALESQASSRLLSARLLHLQDEERRKFSRELHDSLGQYLAAAKMSLDAFANRRDAGELLASARSYLEQSLAETRTISYLLHPPLLDETGLGVAARWFLEGFAQRSGIQIDSEIPEDFPRLPRDVELALFRVLQECLTNIHRHSKSSRADVTIRRSPNEAYLRVRDYGTGIAPEVLRQYRENGTNVGVGLAGMRERVRDQGGNLDIHSDASGATVVVTLPLPVADSLPVAPDALPSALGSENARA